MAANNKIDFFFVKILTKKSEIQGFQTFFIRFFFFVFFSFKEGVSWGGGVFCFLGAGIGVDIVGAVNRNWWVASEGKGTWHVRKGMRGKAWFKVTEPYLQQPEGSSLDSFRIIEIFELCSIIVYCLISFVKYYLYLI